MPTPHATPEDQESTSLTNTEPFETFEDFWPYYVAQHRHPITRALHFAGTTAVLMCVGAAAVAGRAWLAFAPFAGYGPAWIGHFFVERNRPATFRYPLWSLRADFRMYWYTLIGRMPVEVEHAARRYPEGA